MRVSKVTFKSMKNRHLPFLPGFISPSWSIQYSRISISTFPLKSRTLTYLIFPILKKKTQQHTNIKKNNITYNIYSVVMLYQVKLNIYVIISLLDHSPGTYYHFYCCCCCFWRQMTLLKFLHFFVSLMAFLVLSASFSWPEIQNFTLY